MLNFLSHSDLRFFERIVLKSGNMARKMQLRGFSSARKEDLSIVTDADTSTQKYLVKKISARFKNAAVICEENFDYSINLMDGKKMSIVIDPIDGTAIFSMGLPFWCVSVGVFDGFRPAYGFVYSPVCGLFFRSDDENAFCNGVIIKTDKSIKPESETNVFFASELIKDYDLTAAGKIRNLGSTALHAALVAFNTKSRGIAFVGSGNLWDWAGALPILQKADAGVKYMSGKDIDFSAVAANGCRFPEVMLAYSCESFEPARNMINKR
jgi:myo-inositol-1(or 4)-monophosphatase